MSKIEKPFSLNIKVVTFVLILLLISIFNTKHVSAETSLATCPSYVQTDPPILTGTSSSATFTIPLVNLYDSSVSKWTVEFECGIRHQIVDAQWRSDLQSVVTQSISRSTLPGANYSCEFLEGIHTLIVKGGDTPRCRTYYNVVNSDPQCELTISISNSSPVDPPNGITSSSDVKVSGKNLTDLGQFSLYMDNFNPWNTLENTILKDNVNTPSFSDITIPKEKLSPTRHKVYLKRRNTVFINPGDQYGPALCPKEFTVGTPEAPGSVDDTPSPGGTPCTGDNCSKGGGEDCGTGDSRGPGMKTAIGCIHTNPTELVKDFMKFGIGIGGGLAFLMMLLGAFQMLTSAGNPETLNAGKERLTSAVIGLLFIIFAVLLLKIIGVDILGLGGQFGY